MTGKRRFMASVNGDGSTEASRLASRVITSHTRGWDLGIEVVGYSTSDGQDTFDIYATAGSNKPAVREFIGNVMIGEDGKPSFEQFV